MFSDIQKKMFLILIGITVLVIAIVLIYYFVGRSGVVPYERIVEQMERAAKRYVDDNRDELNLEDGMTIVINVNQLEETYMRPLETMIPEEVTCHGDVRVARILDNYAYFPYLSCGEHYQTTNFFDRIMETQGVVDEGSGLYEMGDEYVFRGKRTDNYVFFGERTWRILAIDEYQNVKLLDETSQRSIRWDSKFNTEIWRNVGINVFKDDETEHSYMKIYLDWLAGNNEFLANNDWGKLVYMDLCVGPRELDSTAKDGSEECSITANQLVGVLAVYEFLRVSLEDECNFTTAVPCQNFNWIASLTGRSWTSTPVADTTERVYLYTPLNIWHANASTSTNTKMVVVLNANTIVNLGDGSINNPYVIE